MTNQKGSAMVILLVVLVVVVATVSVYFVFLKKSGEVAVSPTPTATKTVTPTPDETTNWKIYSDEHFGFEVKYPTKYTVAITATEMDVSATFSIDGALQITAIINSSNDLQLDDFVRAQAQQSLLRDYKKMTFMGQPAYEGVSMGLVNSYEIIVKNQKYIYILILNTNNKDALSELKAGLTPEQNQILSTFKFTK